MLNFNLMTWPMLTVSWSLSLTGKRIHVYRYMEMWCVCQRDSPSRSQWVKENRYSSKYGLQREALDHTEQQTIMGFSFCSFLCSFLCTVVCLFVFCCCCFWISLLILFASILYLCGIKTTLRKIKLCSWVYKKYWSETI